MTAIGVARRAAILPAAAIRPGDRKIEAFSPRGAAFPRLAALALAALLLSGPGAGPARAEDPAPSLELDDLLRVPDGVVGPYAVERRGGATKDEWQRRFRAARDDVSQARKTLQASLDELDELGGQGNWKMAPPGLGQLQQQQGPTGKASPDGNQGTGAPLNYGLANTIRGQKQAVAQAERALRDLEVEANLADVPEDWRR